MNDGIEASQSTARANPRGLNSWRTKLQTFAALHADADVRSFRMRCHLQSTIAKMKLIIKLAVDTIAPAGVSIQHAISLDVRGDAKDLLCAGWGVYPGGGGQPTLKSTAVNGIALQYSS